MSTTAPDASRSTRPYPVGSSRFAVSRVTWLPSSACPSASSCRVSAVSNGASPIVTSTVPVSSVGSAARPHSAARPVPATSSWSATTAAGIELCHVSRDSVPIVPYDDHQVLRLHAASGHQRVREQCPAADAMQHLGRRGPHPGAAPGRQHDDGGGAVRRHGRSLSRSSQSGTASPLRIGSRVRCSLPCLASIQDLKLQRLAGCRVTPQGTAWSDPSPAHPCVAQVCHRATVLRPALPTYGTVGYG